MIILNKIINIYNIGNRTYKIDKKNIIIPKIYYLKIMQGF